MSMLKTIIQVGDQIAEMKNSPIADDFQEDIDVVRQEAAEQPCCYFNNNCYANGEYIQSGTSVLVCNDGLWVFQRNSEVDNP